MYPEIVSHVLIRSFYQHELGAYYELGLVLDVSSRDGVSRDGVRMEKQT